MELACFKRCGLLLALLLAGSTILLSPTACLSPGRNGLDIVLLVDTSSSIGPNSLNSAKKFMKMLVKIFGVSNDANGGQNGTRFALLTFSDKVDVVFNLNDRNARSVEEMNRMIDGITGAWPWLGWLSSVAVTDDGKTLAKTCGGALLCERWFMTAASCVSWTAENGTVIPNDPKMVNLYLSDHRLFEKDNDEVHAVVLDIHIHENYTGDVIGDLNVRINDIALLDLGENERSRQPLDKFLRPLCLPVNTALFLADAEWKYIQSVPGSNVGYTAGWGHSPFRAKYPYEKYPFNEIHQNERPVLQKELCRQRFPDLDLERFFCVGKVTMDIDTCVGDIGGPYMVQMSGKRYVTMGLALNTENCDEPYQFSIFLKTIHPEVVDWVEPILNGCNRVEEVEDY